MAARGRGKKGAAWAAGCGRPFCAMIGGGVDTPIEERGTGKGNPNAVLHFGRPLNRRQRELLDKLPDCDSRVTVRKDRVSMKDLAALTAVSGVEFAMFTRGPKRLIIRGDERRVNVDYDFAAKLNALGYKWSGHTHPGLYDGWELDASKGDKKILEIFDQKKSVIYNCKGMCRTFYKI